MLKIVKQTEPLEVSNIIATVFANPGLGKTSLAFTADDVLLLDFDSGAYRSRNRKDTVVIESWEQVANISKDDVHGYKTIAIDTAGRALDMLSTSLINNNGKLGRKGGALTQQGYGVLKSSFANWLKKIKLLGKDIVILAHANESSSGEATIVRIDVQGSSKNEIYKMSDLMGTIYTEDERRILNCNPTEVAFGKNPGLPVRVFPDPAEDPHFFGNIIEETKELLNAESDAQIAAMAVFDEWRQRFKEAEDIDAFNALLPDVKAIDNGNSAVVKKIMVNVAETKGFYYDKDSMSFKQS